MEAFDNEIKGYEPCVCGYDAPVGSAEECVRGYDAPVKGIDMLGEAVVYRFFKAVDALSDTASLSSVLRNCEIDKRNYYKKMRGDRGTSKVPVAWLSSLCVNYCISPEWLLLGKGKMQK